MRILILGAGRVGESVAESLVSERNDITVIDPDPQLLRDLEERLDLRGVAGNGTHPQVLRQAGAEDADMLIACASLDETNLVACKVAHDVFHVPTTIARLRADELKDDAGLLGDAGFAVDRVICPEMNLGQLSLLLRAKYLVDVESHTQVRGLPFRAAELAAVIQEVIDRSAASRNGALQ